MPFSLWKPYFISDMS